jgi:hypothetical protein
MPELKDRIKDGLDEARTLMLGAQVLLGFEYRAAFEPAFDRLPTECRLLKLVSLGLMAVAVALLMAPAAFHRLALHGQSRPELPRFVSKIMLLALLPFALGLGMDLYVAVQAVWAQAALGAALVITGVAVWFWYGLGLVTHWGEGKGVGRMDGSGDQPPASTELKEQIQHTLTEIRVVIPGAQALLGFQFVAMLTSSFEKLPEPSRYLHLASLALVALSIVLLMTPAAYHRLAERGEYSERLHCLAGRFLIAAMVPLALGIAGDFLVVAQKITHSYGIAAAGAGMLLLLCFGLWFGYTLLSRAASEGAAGRRPLRQPAG